MAGAGEGHRDAMVGVLDTITGPGILVVGFNWLEPLALAFGDWGKMTIPAVLGSSRVERGHLQIHSQWLGNLDSNQDSRSQSPMFYR